MRATGFQAGMPHMPDGGRFDAHSQVGYPWRAGVHRRHERGRHERYQVARVGERQRRRKAGHDRHHVARQAGGGQGQIRRPVPRLTATRASSAMFRLSP